MCCPLPFRRKVQHYSTLGRKKNNNTFDVRTEANEIKEKWKGKNWHAEQYSAVPKEIQPGISGVHMTPCYKKFTLFISNSEKKEDTGENEAVII